MFDTPNDKLVWEGKPSVLSSQNYNGKKRQIRTLRKGGGLSGFTKELRVSTILLSNRTAQHQFLLHLEWQLQNYPTIIIM